MIDLHEWYNGAFYQLRIPLPMEPGHVFSYIVRDGDECVMIDTGLSYNGIADLLMKRISEIRDCKLSKLFITHVHIDHYGLAYELRRRLGISIVMHEKDSEQLRKVFNPELFIREAIELFNYYGIPDDEIRVFTGIVNNIIKRGSSGSFEPDIIISGEEDFIHGLRILHTPGHSPGHISIVLDKYGVAFTGDLILPSITTHVGLTPINPGNPLMDYLNSLGKIANLGVKCLFPGHEGEVCNIRERIRELINHRISRMCEALKVLSNGPQSIYDVSKGLTWMNNKDFHELDPFNKYLALTETAAIMKYLESINAIEPLNDGRRYRILSPTCNAQLLMPKSLNSLIP